MPALANKPPVVDSFTADPATPVPGQIVHLRLQAHDPDCATSCTSGCGLTIRADIFTWKDDTGRSGQFSNSTIGASGSPFTASVDWTAPPVEGTYTITGYLADNGGMLCGGRLTTLAVLPVTVSSERPPVIDSFAVTPSSVNAGGTATLTATAHDPEGRALTYSFEADAGSIEHSSASSPTATWKAPAAAGTVELRCIVAAAGAPSVTRTATATVTLGEFRGTISLFPFTATRMTSLPDGRIAIVDGAAGVLAVGSRFGSVTWVRKGLGQPIGIASLGNRLYVVERKAKIISVWSLTGDRVRTIPISVSMPNGLAADSYRNELALADSNAGKVAIIDAGTGATLRHVGVGTLLGPTGVWYENGVLAVADAARNRVFVFAPDGSLRTTLGDDTIFVRPQGVSRDRLDSNWIVTDSFSGELHILADNGTVVGTLGGFSGSEKINNPLDSVFLDGSREIAVPTRSDGVKFFGLTSTLPEPQAAGTPTVTDRVGDDGEALVVAWSLSPDDPARVDHYYVERDSDEDGVFVRMASVSSGSTTWTDLSAGDGACHRYRIVASDGVLTSNSEPSLCALALNDRPPDAPVILQTSADSPFDGTVTWTPVASVDLSHYLLELAGASDVRQLTLDASSTQTTVTSLLAHQQYSVTLWAIDTAGNTSLPARASMLTYPDEAPPGPSNLVVSDLRTGGVAEARWAIEGSTVPIDHYVVTYEPSADGWPSASSTTVDTHQLQSGLINRLPYVVTVKGVTPWGREGAPASAQVMPTAPERVIPVLERVGREGTLGLEDSAGLEVLVPFADTTRELRFVYRTLGTNVVVKWLGRELPSALPDTNGEWVETSLLLDGAPNAGSQLLQFVNSTFPAITAEAAFDRVDLVPLPPRRITSDGWETVIDIQVTRPETRADLALNVQRSESGAKSSGANGSGAEGWSTIACRNPLGNICRDPFRPPQTHYAYRVTVVSPANWFSAYELVQAQTRPPSVPPPVTDLVVTTVNDGERTNHRLDWTPLSYLDGESGEVRAIPGYRIYATDGITMLLRGTASQPPVNLPVELLPAGYSFSVRSVDSQGRESK